MKKLLILENFENSIYIYITFIFYIYFFIFICNLFILINVYNALLKIFFIMAFVGLFYGFVTSQEKKVLGRIA